MGTIRKLLAEIKGIAQQTRRVYLYLSTRQRTMLGLMLGLMALIALISTGIPLILGRLVDTLLAGKATHLGDVSGFILLLLLAYLLKEGLQVLRKYKVEETTTAIELLATRQLFERLHQADLAAISAQRDGAISGRITRSAEGLVKLIKLSFLDFIPAILTAALAMLVAFTRQPLLALAMAGVIPVGALLVLLQLASQKGVRIEIMRMREEMEATAVEQLGGLEYIRAANTHALELDRISLRAEKLRHQRLHHHRVMAGYDCAKSLNESAFHILMVGLAVMMALHQSITIGDVLVVSVLFNAVIAPLREVHRIMDEAHESSLATVDFFNMLAEPADRSFQAAKQTPSPPTVDNGPLIEAEQLRVEYIRPEDGERIVALDNVSLTIQAGEAIGLAGPSGSGKSTLVKALLRLVHPAHGKLQFAGLPIESVDRRLIGRQIGYVSQQPFLFSGTVAENIAYGSQDATQADIERAAELAQIADEIAAMPGGFQALIKQRGANLSGGQRQRIALARVFLLNPPVLVLDEATAALDNENERAVMAAVDAAKAGRTVIIIAHRLSSLRQTDRIYVFESGRIVEFGSYTQLAQRDEGVFAGLLRSADNYESTAVTSIERSPEAMVANPC